MCRDGEDTGVPPLWDDGKAGRAIGGGPDACAVTRFPKGKDVWASGRGWAWVGVCSVVSISRGAES